MNPALAMLLVLAAVAVLSLLLIALDKSETHAVETRQRDKRDRVQMRLWRRFRDAWDEPLTIDAEASKKAGRLL